VKYRVNFYTQTRLQTDEVLNESLFGLFCKLQVMMMVLRTSCNFQHVIDMVCVLTVRLK
jgi:hypothetical protein